MSCLPLPICIVFPVDALQCLRIPPELVVAGIGIDDSRAVVTGDHILCACLGLAEC